MLVQASWITLRVRWQLSTSLETGARIWLLSLRPALTEGTGTTFTPGSAAAEGSPGEVGGLMRALDSKGAVRQAGRDKLAGAVPGMGWMRPAASSFSQMST